MESRADLVRPFLDVGPFSLSILRRSKFASFSPNIGQVYTSPIQSANRGDWGIKASVFAHGGGGARSQIRNLAIPEIDSVLGLPVWKSAEKTARFIRQWGGEGIVARVEPQAGVHSWSTSDGAVMDPWGAQAGRITQANKAIDRLHSDKYYNQFIARKYTDLTQHHYLLHDFFFDRLIKSKFIDASTIHTHELPPLTSPVNLASPEDRIDVSELGEEEHLQAYYYLRSSNAAIAAEWATFAESALDPHSLELARRHLKTKAVVLNEWARIAAELQHMRQPYSHWEEAAANVVEQAGDANELARAQAKAVFAAQPAMVAQLRTAEGREKAEAQWKVEWESLKALAEKRGLSISEWRKGNDAWDFDLRNIRAIKQAEKEFTEAYVSLHPLLRAHSPSNIVSLTSFPFSCLPVNARSFHLYIAPSLHSPVLAPSEQAVGRDCRLLLLAPKPNHELGHHPRRCRDRGGRLARACPPGVRVQEGSSRLPGLAVLARGLRNGEQGGLGRDRG